MNKPPEPELRESFAPARAGERTVYGRRVLWAFIAVVVIAALAFWIYGRTASSPAAPAAGTPAAKGRGGRGGGADASRPIPVVAATAGKGDINIYLDGLGTVTPVRTVTIKTRVDGELVKVLFREGQIVKAGDLLAEIDPRPYQVQLTQMEGQLARDQALLANARLDLQRYQTLLEQDSIARQQLDTQQSLVHQYEGTVEMDRGQVDNAKLQLTYSRITAPVSGRIGLRQVDQGNIVHASDSTGLAVITQLQPITVIFTVPQDSLPAVMKQYVAGTQLAVDAYDRAFQTKLASGTLLSPDNQVDTTTGTVKMKAQFPNEENALFPNQFVNTRMRVDTRRDQTLIPSAAVQRGAQGLFVYVVKPDNTVTVRTVKTSATEGGNAAIDEGVAPGELVVIDGMDRLREGASVDVSSSGGRGTAAGAGSGPGRSGRGAQKGTADRTGASDHTGPRGAGGGAGQNGMQGAGGGAAQSGTPGAGRQ